MVENETTHGGVSRVFRQSDVVLRVEIAHVQCSVKDQSAIRESEGRSITSNFVVNSPTICSRMSSMVTSRGCCRIIHTMSCLYATGAQLEKQFAGRLGLGDDEDFAQNARKSTAGARDSPRAGVAIEKDPQSLI